MRFTIGPDLGDIDFPGSVTRSDVNALAAQTQAALDGKADAGTLAGKADLSGAAFAGPISVTYTSAATGSILYAYTANVKGSGAGTNLIVGDQINAYSVGTGIRQVFGGAREAWSGDATTAPSATAALIAFEPSVIAQHDANDQPLVAIDLPFKNRPDGATAPKNGLGANGYNKFSRAIQISAQARSTAGEYSGWATGIQFLANSIDRTSAGLAVGIDMAALDYTRMASAMRMPANGKLTWDGDARAVGITTGSFVYTISGVTAVSISSAGDMALFGKAGFNGASPQTKPTLPAAATDAATTMALANAIRSALISYGLCS